MNTEKSIKTRRLIIVIIAAVMLAAIVGTIAFTSTNPERKLKAQLELGQKYLTELDYEQAVAAFKEALTIDPLNADALQGLESSYSGWGGLLVSGNNYEKAIQVLNEAIEFLPENTDLVDQRKKVYIGWADYHVNNGDYESGINTLKEAHDLYQEDKQIMQIIVKDYLAWAKSYSENGDYETARSILEEGYAYTNDPKFTSELEKLEQAKMYYMIKSYVDANITEGQPLLGKRLSDTLVQMGLDDEMVEKGREAIRNARVENGTYYPEDIIFTEYEAEYYYHVNAYANGITFVYREDDYYHSMEIWCDSIGDNPIVYVRIYMDLVYAVEDRKHKDFTEYGNPNFWDNLP